MWYFTYWVLSILIKLLCMSPGRSAVDSWWWPFWGFFFRVISETLKKHRQGVQKQRRIIKCITYFWCSSLWLPSWELKVLKCQNSILHNLKKSTSLYFCDNTIQKWASCTSSPIVYILWVLCTNTCGNIQSKGILPCKIVNNQLLCT